MQGLHDLVIQVMHLLREDGAPDRSTRRGVPAAECHLPHALDHSDGWQDCTPRDPSTAGTGPSCPSCAPLSTSSEMTTRGATLLESWPVQ